MNNVAEFLQQNPPFTAEQNHMARGMKPVMRVNKRMPDLQTFYKKMNTVTQRLAQRVAKASAEVTDFETAGPVYNSLLRYVRAKFGQGRPWSHGFLNAFIADFKVWVQQKEEEQNNAETNTEPTTEPVSSDT